MPVETMPPEELQYKLDHLRSWLNQNKDVIKPTGIARRIGVHPSVVLMFVCEERELSEYAYQKTISELSKLNYQQPA